MRKSGFKTFFIFSFIFFSRDLAAKTVDDEKFINAINNLELQDWNKHVIKKEKHKQDVVDQSAGGDLFSKKKHDREKLIKDVKNKNTFLRQKRLDVINDALKIKTRKTNGEAQDQVVRLEKELARQSRESAAASDKLRGEINDLKEKNSQLTARLTLQTREHEKAGGEAQDQVVRLEKELARQSRESAAASDKLRGEINDLKEKNSQLTARLTLQTREHEKAGGEAQDQVVRLEKEIATVEKKAPALEPLLKTVEEKESYSLGVSLAEEAMLRAQHDKRIGINIDLNSLSAGFNDARAGKLRLNNSEIKINIDKVNNKSKLNAKKAAQTSLSLIKKAIGDGKVVKKTNGISLVLEKKGSEGFKKGDLVNFKIIEKLVSGKIVNSYNQAQLIYGDDTPDLLKDAIKFGGRSSIIKIYGLGENFYSSDSLPKDIGLDSPVVYIIEVY